MKKHEHRDRQHRRMEGEGDSRQRWRDEPLVPSRYGRHGSSDQGPYGGWGSGEGQGEYGGDGYSAQGEFSNQRFTQYGDQLYGEDYGQRGIGWQNRQDDEDREFGQGMGWEQSPSRARDVRYDQQFSDRRSGRYGSDRDRYDQRSWRSQEGYGHGPNWKGGGDRGVSAAGSWMVGPHCGRGPQGYQRSDARIEEDVCEYLTQHGMLDATGIQVQVENGEVTLTGMVESRQAKRLAEDILDGIFGVKDIHNQLRVQRDQGHQNPIMAQDQRREGGNE